jgi:nicotinate-nucleotide adenylyltransferase
LRIAIFGGTFDPIHTAHTRVAAEAAERFHLDRVLFIPSANPPHKPAGQTTPFFHRYRMVELACSGDHRFQPSRLEEDTAVSYSIDTILRLKQTLAPGDVLFFLIGADAFAEIATWRCSAEVIRVVDFIVVSRPGYSCPVPPGARVHSLETLALVISSSDIRRELESGGAVPELHPDVLRYIQQHGLYR